MIKNKRAFAGIAAAVLFSIALPVNAGPVCPDEPRAACGNRIFPEASNTASFVQLEAGEYESGIKALARDFPRFVKIKRFSDILGRDAVSAGGREMWLVEITDFEAPEAKKVPVAVSLSVHGPERAGLEGGVRYMEDLARWAKDEPNHELRNGTDPDSIGVPVSEVLKKVHLYLACANPDGWASGDIQNGGVYERGNENGFDLNRQFPTMGWTRLANEPMTQPEATTWVELMERVDPVVTADLHGELTSAQNAFADMMLPAGQWDPRHQEREDSLARHMKSNVERYFEIDGVEAGTASGVAGMKPAEYATGYDVVGYDASGFMGDWFTQAFDAVDMDVEHFLSHLVPNSTWVQSLERAHIAAVRGEIEAMIVEALVTKDVRVKLNLGKIGYVFDRRVISSADGYGGPKLPKGVRPVRYRSTRMTYFKKLSKYARTPLRKVRPESLRRGLRGLDSLVIADEIPSRALRKRSAARLLRRYVKSGGNLVLTDSALKWLARMKFVKKSAIRRHLFNAGHLNLDRWKDPYLKGVHSTASQTYYEVPLGYSVDSDSSPHWTVARRAFKKARGRPIAHIEEESRIGLGRVKLGRGTIGIIGALLPPATEKFDHFYGLADYAVSVAGGQILDNMLKVGR